MKDSGVIWIGDIPNDWNLGRVKHAFFRKNEKAHQVDPIVLSLARSGVRVRDMSVNEGQIAESYYDYNPVTKDDLLLNPMDLYSGANCSISNVEGVISPAYINLRYKEGFSPLYYDYYFKLQYWSMAFFAHGKGVSFDNRWTLNADTLLNYLIPIPPLSVQESIANFLSLECAKIDRLICIQEDFIEKLKLYRQSLIAETVTQGINKHVSYKSSGEKWLKEIPSHWQIIYPKALFRQRKDRAKENERQLTASQQLGIIYQDQYMALTGNKVVIVEKDFDILKHVEKGDFVISMRSFQGGLEYSENTGCISSAYVMLIPNKNLVFDRYYKWLFKSSIYINALQSTSNLVRDGQAMRYANFIQIKLPNPPIEEQESIANFLDDKCLEIDNMIALKTKKIAELHELKKSLIYEYVTGKKEV